MKRSNAFHPDFLAFQKEMYETPGFTCTNIIQDTESTEYGACTFDLNNKNILLHVTFRVAKITPTKVGQFVTLWKRIPNGPIRPHDLTDNIDLFVISVRDKNNTEKFGHFIFPLKILCEKNIVSKDFLGGKLGIRVYPPWDITTSAQAQKTQAWQLLYFFDASSDERAPIQKLYM